jgi:hypothetical protein
MVVRLKAAHQWFKRNNIAHSERLQDQDGGRFGSLGLREINAIEPPQQYGDEAKGSIEKGINHLASIAAQLR